MIVVTVMLMVVTFAELIIHIAKCRVVTGAGTTSWHNQMFKVPAAGLMILKHIHACHHTRRNIVMVMIVVTVMLMVVTFAELIIHIAKCRVVTGAGTTSWHNQMFKVPAAGLVILKHIHACHHTRRNIVMVIVVTVMVEVCAMVI